MKKTLKRLFALSLAVMLCAFAPAVTQAADIAPGYRIQKSMGDADRAFCARQNKEGSLKKEGSSYVWALDSWVEFDVEVPKTGKYIVGIVTGYSASGKLQHRVTVDGNIVIEQLTDGEGVPITGTHDNQKDLDIGIISFDTEGLHTVRLDLIGGSAQYSTYFYLKFLGEPIEVVSVTAEEKDLTAGEAISAGCDVVTAEFSKDIAASELTGDLEGKVSLKNKNGKSLKLIGEADGSKLLIKLAETLRADEEYTLEFTDVKDNLQWSSVEGESCTFATIAGDGTAAMADTKATVYDETVTLDSVMLSSAGAGIKGRSYSVYLSYDGGEKSIEPVFEGESGDDGVITYEYIMSAGSADGDYTFHITAEYIAEEVLVPFVYVTPQTRDAIESAVKGCTTAEEVKEVLTDELNAKYIGINSQEEARIEVYAHFTDKDISFQELASEFRKYVAVENFRQAKSAIRFKNVVSKEENWINMGLNKTKYDSLKSATTVNTAIIGLSSIDDADTYIANVEAIIDSALLGQIGKTKAVFNAEDISAYVNQGVNIPLAFDEEISDIKKFTFKITVSDEGLTENSELTLKTDGISSMDINGKEITGSVEYDSTASLSEVGSVSLQIPGETGMYNVSLEGEIIYAPSDFDFILKEASDKAEVIITVTENPKDTPIVESQSPSGKPSGRPSGGGGGVSGGGSSAVIKPSVDTEVKEVYSFTDVPKEHWAFESVDYLLKNGIIGETEDKLYNPDEKMAREEIVKMMVLALGLTDENAVSKLSDVSKSNPYYKYIASAEKYGIIYGNDLGQFMIGKPVTREDICVILHRAVKKIYSFAGSDEIFEDDAKISDYAKEAVYDMLGAGIINGMGDGTFAPKDNMTRAQAAKVIYEIVKAVER